MARIAKLLRLSLVLPALLCVIGLRLLRGSVRIGVLQANRIGHLAGNVEVHLCESDAGMHKGMEIWFAPGEVCNAHLLKMWSRVITIDRTGFVEIIWKVNRLFNGWELVEIPSGNLDRDVNNLLEKYHPHLSFTDAEEECGQRELRRMGIPKDAKWICLIVRDSAYLPELSYHAYRDSDIDSYIDAAVYLADRGYYVVRMGAKMAKPLPFTSKRIIDYADFSDSTLNSNVRSDFMDIYLAAKCSFAISTSTGLDAVCSAFRCPICYVNFVPLEYLPTWNRSLAIWKHHWKDGNRLAPKEIWESGAGQFMRADQYAEAGITLVDNTPGEIREIVEEMAETMKSLISHDPNRSQHGFWRTFPRSISPYTGQPLHGQIRMRIGHEFLKGYA